MKGFGLYEMKIILITVVFCASLGQLRYRQQAGSHWMLFFDFHSVYECPVKIQVINKCNW